MNNADRGAARALNYGIKGAGSRTILSVLLAAAIALPPLFLCGCGKKEQQRTAVEMPPENITEDIPWYEGKTVYVEDGYDMTEFESMYSEVAGVTDDYIIWNINGTAISDLESDDYTNENGVSVLRVFDHDGNMLYDVDALAEARDYLPEAEGVFMSRTYLEDDKIVIEVTEYTGGEYHNIKLLYDMTEERIVFSEELPEDSLEPGLYRIPVEVDGWKITLCNNYEGMTSTGCSIELRSPDGEVTVIDLNEELPNIRVSDLSGFIYMGNSKLLLKTIDFSYCLSARILLDLNTCSVTDVGNNSDYLWISELDNMHKYQYFEGIGNLVSDQGGIRILNLEDKTEETYLSYDNCNVNRSDIASLDILSVEDGHIVFGSNSQRTVYTDGTFTSARSVCMMTVLDRAPSNPHVGDKVLTAATIDRLSYPMAEAIRLFNEEDNGALILSDPRYLYNTVAAEVEWTEDMDYSTYDLSVRSAVMSRLSIDLMAGDGPDIIIDAMDHPQLNKAEMLLDLSQDVLDGAVYENIIEGSRTHGFLYQMPLSYTLDGMLVQSSDVDTSVPGFSYGSYNDYVSGPLSGMERSRMTRLEFTGTCFEQLGSRICVDGTYDFGSDEFRQMASFVNDLILPDEIGFDPAADVWSENEANLSASSYVHVSSPRELLRMTQGLTDEKILYGFPSVEPSGVIVNINQSVAISAATEDPDSCHAFVKMLSGADFQDLFAADCGLPVNSESLRNACADDCVSYNNAMRFYVRYHNERERAERGEPIAEGDPDRLFEIIDGYVTNASGVRATDEAVMMIVREEIQAYYAGQKSIDEITGIIQDRVDTYLNERG